jgi:phage replication O-like protein O
MSNRLKPNFTAVPNVIFDKVMHTLAAGAVKVLFAICRFTYGYNKPEGDRISLKQLQDMTGMARGSVARSVKELGTLVTISPGDPSRQLASKYRLNVEIPDADLLSLFDQSLVSIRDQASLPASLKKRPSKDIPKKEDIAHRKKRERPDTDPRVKILLTAFVDKYLARVNTPYVVVDGKDPALLKSLLTAGHDTPAIEAAMDRYFADDYQAKIGFDIGVFKKSFNRLNSAGSRKKHNYEEGAFPEA